ncbi:unnamed protein product [Effrenium voratum]|uniref:Uncharacterized protein n=1 Tax=Effrenium voratum TaxID=2562239 RepID=A0AA36HYX1_9DINO|nr:unnamed protein product [Effrenium voratum]
MMQSPELLSASPLEGGSPSPVTTEVPDTDSDVDMAMIEPKKTTKTFKAKEMETKGETKDKATGEPVKETKDKQGRQGRGGDQEQGEQGRQGHDGQAREGNQGGSQGHKGRAREGDQGQGEQQGQGHKG